MAEGQGCLVIAQHKPAEFRRMSGIPRSGAARNRLRAAVRLRSQRDSESSGWDRRPTLSATPIPRGRCISHCWWDSRPLEPSDARPPHDPAWADRARITASIKNWVRQAIVPDAQSRGPGYFVQATPGLRHRTIADSRQAIVPEARGIGMLHRANGARLSGRQQCRLVNARSRLVATTIIEKAASIAPNATRFSSSGRPVTGSPTCTASRGRVGRSASRYCHLLLEAGQRSLTSVRRRGSKRSNSHELWAGSRSPCADLEIRGA